jgi:hypothetical protein
MNVSRRQLSALDRSATSPEKVRYSNHKALSIAVVLVGICYVAVAALAAPSDPADERPVKRLLDYVEAEGDAEPSSLGLPVQWLTATRLLFNASKSPALRDGTPIPYLEKIDGLTMTNDVEYFQVMLFDLTTRTTSRHLDGKMDMSLEKDLKFDGHDEIAVGYLRYGYSNRPQERDRSYSKGAKGPFGEEEPFIFYAKDHPPTESESCPGYEGRKTRALRLKPEHGCLQTPDSRLPAETPMIYFRADGKRIDIDVQAQDFLMVHWIEWLGAYLLNDSTTRLNGRRKPFSLMMPGGQVLAVPFTSHWTPSHVRPTRAGFIGTINLGSARRQSGLFLMHQGTIVQVAEGPVHPQVSVSPDGCHVAYIADIYLPLASPFRPTYRRVRVMDVCAGLEISPASNPFQW